MAVRERGRPGDPNPSPPLFTGALKLRFLDARGGRPAFAADVYVDRFNWRPATGLRLIASTAEVGRLRFAGYAGAEVQGGPSFGVTAGLAAAFSHLTGMETALEGTYGPGGALIGGAFRLDLAPDTGVSLGLSWLPSDRGFRARSASGSARRCRGAGWARRKTWSPPSRRELPRAGMTCSPRTIIATTTSSG